MYIALHFMHGHGDSGEYFARSFTQFLFFGFLLVGNTFYLHGI